MSSKISHLSADRVLASYAALFALVFSVPLLDLMRYSLHPDHSRYNAHIVFVPFVSAYLLYQIRNQIEKNRRLSPAWGIPVIAAGFLLFMAGIRAESFLARTDYVSVRTLSVVICWGGGFLLLFGRESFRIALFPLLFLLFLVPIPTMVMEQAFRFLQMASCEMSYLLVQLTGVPVLREGIDFHFAGLTITVAPECSGMRATISLVIVAVLAGHLFLRSGWRKLLAVSATLPITILGNSIRITVLTLMALYVNQEFMKGDSLLHERGGWALFLVDLLLLGGIIALLRRREKHNPDGSHRQAPPRPGDGFRLS